MAGWGQEYHQGNGTYNPDIRSNGYQALFGDIPRTSLSSFVPLKEKDKNTELQTQFSSRSSGADSRAIRKPPLNPRPPDNHAPSTPTGSDHTFKHSTPFLNIQNGFPPSKPTPSLTTRSASPKHSPAASPVAGMAWSSIIDNQASKRVGPNIGDAGFKPNNWNLEQSIRRTVNLRESELFFISNKIVVCVRHNAVPADKESQRLATSSTAALWGPMTDFKTDATSLQNLTSAGQEVADYMSAEFAGRYSVILSTPELAQLMWEGPIHLVQESPFEPAPLQESVMLLLHLERYLNSSPDNIVLFFQGNVSVISALISLQEPLSAHGDSSLLLADLCALRRENVPVAGSRRYLAMLEACMNSPELIEACPKMVLASLRLFGDHEFVRSTENLIRVHAEIHHSG
eukprot:CAMPEP_0113712256 /NCGR_PEP_ID=MMETSP0038_2-20120614/31276_1 /TAXON_ID=2898 /ORGANISM="Cryptomonas paramecium" /LENGTH=400 /DNA_ID=CAMNT_0000638733 /DNA_START=1 /DNA_END=1200 /DNA_ORIENTATION=- /assembly_acc=CAM_ASM_000170